MSPASWLQRVGRMDREELVFRARTAARARAQYLASAWRPRGWHRAALATLLRPSAGTIDRAVERLEVHDWAGAHHALCEHFHRRVSRFPVSPHALPELADRVRRRFPQAASDAASRADRVAAGCFDLLGYQALDCAAPSGAIDWHRDPVHDRHAPRAWWSRVRYLDPSIGDHKIIWELNRHQHFLGLGRAAWLTGRREYRNLFVRHLQAWLRDNPPLVGVNWASMLELSLRSLSWLWALHFFVEPPDERSEPGRQGPPATPDGSPWMVDLVLGLERQLSHVQRNLSRYFSPNTHLTGEALGLYVCGQALPELSASSEWVETGRAILLEEIDRQVLPDGGHAERSTHYLRYTLDFYLLALAMARVTEDSCAERFAAAVDRLATSTRVLADEHGRLPTIGDDDGGCLFPICGRSSDDVRDSLATAAALLCRPDLSIGGTPEETMWLVGNQPAWMIEKKRPESPGRLDVTKSAALPHTGFFVSRLRMSDHVVIDCGPHGYLNGGHAHADALSLTATLDGCRLLVDPGTSTYTMSPEVRDRFRSSAMHNTLTLDGRSQSVPAGPFHWTSVATGRVQRWVTSSAFDYFEGVHDGYLPALHRRRVLVMAGGPILVVDTVSRQPGVHRAEVHWHLDAAWRLDGVDAGRTALRHEDGRNAWLLSPGSCLDFLAGDEGGLGWRAPIYGRLEPALTLRLAVEDQAPLSVVTMFGMAPRAEAPGLDRLPATTDEAGADPVALLVRWPGFADLLVFGARAPLLPGSAERRTAPRPTHVQLPAALHQGDGVDTEARFQWTRFFDNGDSQHLAML